MAPGAFLCDFFCWIDISHSVRAGRHTVPAADAPVGIDIDDSVRAYDAGIDGTDRHADWIFAVIAEDGQKEFAGVGIMPFFDSLDPDSPHTERDIILTLTGQRTRIASNAFP